jgi:hypothetical protein
MMQGCRHVLPINTLAGKKLSVYLGTHPAGMYFTPPTAVQPQTAGILVHNPSHLTLYHSPGSKILPTIRMCMAACRVHSFTPSTGPNHLTCLGRDAHVTPSCSDGIFVVCMCLGGLQLVCMIMRACSKSTFARMVLGTWVILAFGD